VLAAVIASGAVPVAKLKENFTQAVQSRIVAMAHRINKGGMPEFRSRRLPNTMKRVAPKP